MSWLYCCCCCSVKPRPPDALCQLLTISMNLASSVYPRDFMNLAMAGESSLSQSGTDCLCWPVRAVYVNPVVGSFSASVKHRRLMLWRHFDVIGWILFGGLHFWRHWFNMAKILSKFGEQQLVMVNYACGFNQSEMGKYLELIIMSIIILS